MYQYYQKTFFKPWKQWN